MEAYDLQELVGRLDGTRPDMAEFFKAGGLKMSVAAWPAGAADPQSPHQEDEVYVVSRGRARLRVGDDDVEVGPNSILYVPAGADHEFHDIAEDLEVLVVWAGAK
jgi:mannose-6-phosphate isomerase-like protein (cupin superfamily)